MLKVRTIISFERRR